MSSSHPRPALAAFLGQTFTSGELLTWVYLHLHALKDQLPTDVTLNELKVRVVELAANAGLVDADFFAALRQHLPGRSSEIAVLAHLWGLHARVTDTARILDRIAQWTGLLDACGERDDHLVFLVRGGREASVQQFMERIVRYLDHQCARRHFVAHVGTGYDQQMVGTVQSWERAFIEKTHLAEGTLDVALRDFSEQCAVLFLLDHRGGPLPLAHLAARPQPGRSEPLRALGGFLSSNLRHALTDGGLAHPLRIVIPIEVDDDAVLDSLEPLRRALVGAAPLVFADELVLTFPGWPEVEPSLRAKMQGVDDATLTTCKHAYEAVAARPDRSIRLLGNELHTIILDWKDANRSA